MTTLSLALSVVILVTRLPLLMLDRRVHPWEVLLSWGLQVVFALLLVSGFAVCPLAWVSIGLLHALLHFAWWHLEKRFPHQASLRLGLSASLLILAISAGSPWTQAHVRDHTGFLMAAAHVFSPFGLFIGLPWHGLLGVLFAYLLCLNEANTLIRGIIERMGLKPSDATHEHGGLDERMLVAVSEYKRGRLIGVLERSILFFLILGGQYSALGFVITAKAMARFKSLDDRNFSEYFLLGTLLSVAMAGALAMGVRL